jgi:hypothetical protein
VFVGFAVLLDREPVRINKRCRAGDEIDMVAKQLIANYFLFRLDDVVAAQRQVGESDVFLYSVAGAVELALAKAGEKQNGLAQRFAGDRARVDADSAHHRSALDNADLFANLGGLYRRLLPGGSGTDHQHIVVSHVRSECDPMVKPLARACCPLAARTL